MAHMTPNECLPEVSSRILTFDGVGGMRRTRSLPETLYPADFTNLLTSGVTPSKNFWFLNFTFPSPIVIEITWYIRFWRFYTFSLYCYGWTIAVFTTNPSVETGQQSDKKKSKKKSRRL